MAKPPTEPPRPGRKEEREARLAEALRENLKKRKAQARARTVRNHDPDADPKG